MINLLVLFLIFMAQSLLKYNVKIKMVVRSPYHIQKLFPTIICIWEGWIKLMCFALCMVPPKNQKNGGTVFFLV